MITRMISRRRSLALVSALLLGAGCSLKVNNPDVIDPGKLAGLQGANTYYAGAIGDFALAHDGGNGPNGLFGGVVMTVGLFSDEMQFGGTPPEVRQLDLKDVVKENSFFRDTYLGMHRARESAERAAKALVDAGVTDGRAGEMYAVAGLMTTILGETFCSGIPFSSTLSGSIEYGQPLATSEVMDKAQEYASQALANAGNNTQVQNFAKVMSGRAYLDQGKYAQAGAAVAGVPTEFTYVTSHSDADARTQNLMKGFIFDFDYTPVSVGSDGVSKGELNVGLPFAVAGDPRVVTNFTGPSRFDGKTPMYRLTLYSSFNSPVVVASGVEARLIEAEAALKNNDITTFYAKLDAARAPWGLGPVTRDSTTATGRAELLFAERGFALFATGHRVGDQRRMTRTTDGGYGLPELAAGLPPKGAEYHKDNLLLGGDRSFVIPANEENNPNYKSSMCDKTKP